MNNDIIYDNVVTIRETTDRYCQLARGRGKGRFIPTPLPLTKEYESALDST